MSANNANLPEGASITYSPTTIPTRAPDLRILHYNDVYHVDASSAEPAGGYARFQTLCNYYRSDPSFAGQPELVTAFSGDAFNPSLESSVTKGSHMVGVLNGIGTDVACVGNHDLDFGVKQLRNLMSQCKFPWLLGNIMDPSLGKDVPLANCAPTHVHTVKSTGLKIGFIGIGEREWLATINSLPPIEYRSATETARLHSKKLREEEKVDIVISLSHAREPNDEKLAGQTGQSVQDVILGGHDHFYNHQIVNGVHVLRSGTDFKQLSYIEGWKNANTGKWDFRITRRDVVSSIPENSTALALVDRLTKSLKSRLERPIGYTLAPLDARFSTVRLKESNIGNFVCDLMKNYHQADCCMMAGGTIRGDQIYPPGVLKLKDIMNCFPFEDPVVVIKVKGQAMLDALENSVSLYPALEGRFLQVSGISYSFSPNKAPGNRIVSVKINNEPLDLEKKYVLATRGYMARGKDGFTSLLCKSEGGEAEEIVEEENGVLISTLIRQFFMSLKVLGKWKNMGPSMERHWMEVKEEMGVCLKCHGHDPKRQDSATSEYVLKGGPVGAAPLNAALLAIKKSAPETVKLQVPGLKQPALLPSGAVTPSGYDSDADVDAGYDSEGPLSPVHPGRKRAESDLIRAAQAADKRAIIVRRVLRKWRRLAGLKEDPQLCDHMTEGEFTMKWTTAVAPRLEKRIKIVEE